MNEFERYRFIFLCGLHRSGTSPLFQILREHPEISGFRNTGVPEDEGQHLQTVFPPATIHGGPGRFGLMREAHLTEDSDLLTPENKLKLFKEWSRHWDLTKPNLLEKSPPNLIKTRFLQSVFPNSYFIVILRHPVAVSLATWKWARCSLESLTAHWVRCHEIFERDRSHLATPASRSVRATPTETIAISMRGKSCRWIAKGSPYSVAWSPNTNKK